MGPKRNAMKFREYPLEIVPRLLREIDDFAGQAHMCYTICMQSMDSPATSVRVSRDTLAELERFQRALRTHSADETIREVLKLQRTAVIDRLAGSLRGRVTRFTEADRIDSDR